MASKSLNLLLNSALGAMAVGIVMFNTGMLDPYLPSGRTAQPEAAGEAGTGTQAPDKAGKEQQDVAAAPAGQVTEDNAAKAGNGEQAGGGDAAPAVEVTPPRFDIVRVEADGNVVIAGNASAGSQVEVITGARTLGADKAGPEGDFAVVLTDPLAPGDYTLVLRATTPENVVAMSTETAIISIPETKSGDVLAIVDEPGKPSKLITVPEGQEAAGAAKEEAEGETEVAAAAAEPSGEAEQSAKADDAGSDGAAVENTEAAGAGEKAAAESEEPVAEEETEIASADPAKPEAADVDDGDAKAEAKDQVAAAADTPKADENVPAAQFNIAVDAVEIEGDHVFVAGTANPGKVVRVYANKDLIGETQSSAIGRFLVESSRGLAVGQYIIRADLLEVGSAEVIARAAVPFEREEGEAIAAIAPKEEMAEDAQTGAGGEAASEPEKPADAGTQVANADGSAKEETAESASNGDASGASKSEPDAAGKAETEVAATEPGAIEDPKTEEEEDVALTAPKLEKTAGSVIIRRGDTLWRISRRVYGRGIRYTTIYTANRDQIENPHRIWPGQVFDVPGESQEGDKADLSAIADQNPDNAKPKTQ